MIQTFTLVDGKNSLVYRQEEVKGNEIRLISIHRLNY
jgi:hypothetical protein